MTTMDDDDLSSNGVEWIVSSTILSVTTDSNSRWMVLELWCFYCYVFTSSGASLCMHNILGMAFMRLQNTCPFLVFKLCTIGNQSWLTLYDLFLPPSLPPWTTHCNHDCQHHFFHRSALPFPWATTYRIELHSIVHHHLPFTHLWTMMTMMTLFPWLDALNAN